jgi:hypothetical protein
VRTSRKTRIILLEVILLGVIAISRIYYKVVKRVVIKMLI